MQIASRAIKILAAVAGGFVVTVGAIVGYWGSAVGQRKGSDGWALELAGRAYGSARRWSARRRGVRILGLRADAVPRQTLTHY